MIKAAMPQLKHTPVGKRLEMKINEIEAGPEGDLDVDGDAQSQQQGPDQDYIPLSHSTSTSPSVSDTVSGNDTSLTEDTGVTSSDTGLYSPESMPKSVKVNTNGNRKGKQKVRGRREDEELEELLQ